MVCRMIWKESMLIIGKNENGKGLLHICDFKAGQGVFVDANHNPQMMLYAIGALHAYGYIYDTQTAPGANLNKVKKLVGKLMKRVALEYGLNTDLEILVNPTGKFEIGGSFADCGVTGRKLACDTYGGVGHIGGGALSGKEASKVDRSGAYAARKVARDIVAAGYADKCEVQIAYAIGVAKPVSIHVDCFGTEKQDISFIEQYVAENYNLTPKGITESLDLLNVDYNRVSAYGHFGKAGLPWEK